MCGQFQMLSPIYTYLLSMQYTAFIYTGAIKRRKKKKKTEYTEPLKQGLPTHIQNFSNQIIYKHIDDSIALI